MTVPPGTPTLLASLSITLKRGTQSVVLVRHPSCPSPLPIVCHLVEPMTGSPDPTPSRFVPLALLLTPDALSLLASAIPLHPLLSLSRPEGPPQPAPEPGPLGGDHGGPVA